MRRCVALLIALPIGASALTCQLCHPQQVEGYSHYSMAHSLRRAAQEPDGSFQNVFGTKFTVYSNRSGTWQRMERAGETSEYRIEYVIGSGKHASGYLVRIGTHLFQSPIGYYTARHAYDMDPDMRIFRTPTLRVPLRKSACCAIQVSRFPSPER